MEIHCHLILNYESEDTAEKVLRAVIVDNEDFIQAKREGNSIVSDIKAESFLNLLHTIEDYLTCVSIAEKTIKKVGDSPHGHEQPHLSQN